MGYRRREASEPRCNVEVYRLGGKRAATNVASASAATSCGLGALRSRAASHECFGSALHEQELKSLPALSARSGYCLAAAARGSEARFVIRVGCGAMRTIARRWNDRNTRPRAAVGALPAAAARTTAWRFGVDRSSGKLAMLQFFRLRSRRSSEVRPRPAYAFYAEVGERVRAEWRRLTAGELLARG